MAGSAKIFFKDFACSSKIKPAVVGSSKEFTTSLIAENQSLLKMWSSPFGGFAVC
jgi:hypothetical protein